jgi:hypothetical protein
MPRVPVLKSTPLITSPVSAVAVSFSAIQLPGIEPMFGPPLAAPRKVTLTIGDALEHEATSAAVAGTTAADTAISARLPTFRCFRVEPPIAFPDLPIDALSLSEEAQFAPA